MKQDSLVPLLCCSECQVQGVTALEVDLKPSRNELVCPLHDGFDLQYLDPSESLTVSKIPLSLPPPPLLSHPKLAQEYTSQQTLRRLLHFKYLMVPDFLNYRKP